MKAILRSYGCDGRYGDDLVEIHDNHDFASSPHEADTIPFSVGSNQQILELEEAGLMEIPPRNPLRDAAPRLLEALKFLAEQIDLSKLTVRRDFSVINAHAFACRVIREAEGKDAPCA